MNRKRQIAIAISVIVLFIMASILWRATPNKSQKKDESDSELSYRITLNPDALILVDEMKNTPEGINRQLPHDLVAFDLPEESRVYKPIDYTYLSSKVRKWRVFEFDVLNEFEWVNHDGIVYLFQSEKPYSGWYRPMLGGLRYYEDGKTKSEFSMSPLEEVKLFSQWYYLKPYIQGTMNQSICFEPISNDNHSMTYLPVNEHIKYLSTDDLILTKPGGIRGASYKESTNDYIDLPIEVIAKASTVSGQWIQLAIAGEEIGWVEDNPDNYVETQYSEQELLDLIGEVLEEEIQGIDADIGASFIHHSTMGQVSVNNHAFFPASTQKIYVLVSFTNDNVLSNHK